MELTENQKENIRKRLQAMVTDYDCGKQAVDADAAALSQKVENLPEFVERIDSEFEKLTKIGKKDIPFLIFASSLQVARQLIVARLKTRLSDQEAAKRTPFHKEEHSDRDTTKYYASKEEIATNPVPFDAVRKSEGVKNNVTKIRQ